MTDLIPEGIMRLLLVEGSDDKQFFNRLISHMQSKTDAPFDLSRYKIRKFGGKDKLGKYLYELVQYPNFSTVEKIWIVRDADYNGKESVRERGAPLRALDSVNGAIQQAYTRSSQNLEPPELQGFMMPTESKPSFSLLVLPDGDQDTEGTLETLLLEVLANDPMMPCVDDYFRCVKKNRPESAVAINREDKSRLSVLLSGKLILRDAARSKDATGELPRYMYNMKWWDDRVFDDPVFDDTKNFLTQLLTK